MLSGHIDLFIGDFIRLEPDFFAKFERVLVTCLDSVREVATARIGQALFRHFPVCTTIGDAVLIPGRLVREVDDALGLFAGFDEVWCFTAIPEIVKPPHVSVLPPPGYGGAEVPAAVLEWMTKSGCRLALGDGFGMNYVTPEPSIQNVLKAVPN